MPNIPTVLTSTLLLAAWAVVMSLGCMYIPGLNTAYAALDSGTKAMIQGIGITVVALICGVLSWTGVMVFLPAGRDGILLLIFQWVIALQSNQATYQLFKLPQSVVRIKALRWKPPTDL
jgi:multisubunit Na+/H+ antiporter MnhG subunit